MSIDFRYPNCYTSIRYLSILKQVHAGCMMLHVVHCSLSSAKQWEYIITRFVSISQWHFHLFDNAKKIVLQYSAISDIYLPPLALLSNTKYTNFSKQKLDCCLHFTFTLTNWICQLKGGNLPGKKHFFWNINSFVFFMYNKKNKW